MKYKTIIDKYNKEQNSLSMDEIEMRLPPELFHISPPILINIANIQPSCYYIQNLLVIFAEDLVISDIIILILLSTIYETKNDSDIGCCRSHECYGYMLWQANG